MMIQTHKFMGLLFFWLFLVSSVILKSNAIMKGVFSMKDSLDIHIIFGEEASTYIRRRAKQHGLTMCGFIKMAVMQYMRQDKEYLESNK